jgi:hypothetical protein
MVEITKVLGTVVNLGKVNLDNWGFKFTYVVFCPIILFSSLITILRYFYNGDIHCQETGGKTVDQMNAFCGHTQNVLHTLINNNKTG